MMVIITRRHRMLMQKPPLSCLGALAIELSPGADVGRRVLSPEAAGGLAALVPSGPPAYWRSVSAWWRAPPVPPVAA